MVGRVVNTYRIVGRGCSENEGEQIFLGRPWKSRGTLFLDFSPIAACSGSKLRSYYIRINIEHYFEREPELISISPSLVNTYRIVG